MTQFLGTAFAALSPRSRFAARRLLLLSARRAPGAPSSGPFRRRGL